MGDAVAVHQIRKFDLDLNAVRVRSVVVDFDSGVVSGSKLGESGGGSDPVAGGNESLEIVRLHGERLDTSEEWGLSVEEKRPIRSSQSVIFERVEQIPDDGSGLVGTRNSGGVRTVTGVGNRGVLVRVQQPNGVVEGEVLKRCETAPGNAPQTAFCGGTVREGQEIFVSPIAVLDKRESIVKDGETCAQIEELFVESTNVGGGIEMVKRVPVILTPKSGLGEREVKKGVGAELIAAVALPSLVGRHSLAASQDYQHQ